MIKVTAKKTYGDRVVLDVKDLVFEDGKKYALIGANGSGKSTLLNVIAGQLKAEGKVEFDKRATIGYMPQTSYAFSMSVLRNIMLPCKAMERRERVYRANGLIEDLGLKKLKRKNASRLSGGETQRMALARTLMVKCDVLILDEPTAAMDVEQAKTVIELLNRENEFYKNTLIFATHSLKQAEALADVVIFMSEGKAAEISDAKTFLTDAVDKRLIEFISAS